MKLRSLDLKYQQNEPDFEAKVIKFSCVTLPTVYVWELLYVGIFSHFFGENDHPIIQFLQKYFEKQEKNIYISDHNFTCASVV